MHRFFKYMGVALLVLVSAIFMTGRPVWASPATDSPVVQIVKNTSPAVVNIDVEVKAKQSALPFFNDPFFKQFFGDEYKKYSRSVPMKGRGSGFIVSKDGQILTNDHVVDGADKITVTLADGTTYDAKVLGKDPTFDLAVIKINPKKDDLPTLELGDSDATQVGEWVIAIGNPYGFEHTVTVGVVSAKNRSIHAQDVNFDGFLQTDAAINPGNSGGPLLNMDGKVVGINSAIVPYAQGLGFAVPINMAKQIMNDLITYGKVKRGWLGISVQNLTKEFAENYNIKAEKGVIVGDIFKDSAAERAGLQVGDVIVSVNNTPVKDVQTFVNTVRGQAPGSELKMDVIREGKTLNLTAKLDEIPDSEGNASAPSSGPTKTNVLQNMGISIVKLTPEMRRQYRIESKADLIVSSIDDGSVAQAAGIREGDLLLQVNGRKVSDPSDVDKAVKKDSKSVVLLIERDGRTFFASLKAE